MAKVLSIFLPLLKENTSPEEVPSALEVMAQWAYRFSPLVAIDTDEGVSIDITGSSKLFPCDLQLIAQIKDALADGVLTNGILVSRILGQPQYSRIAIAPSLGSAWALSRYSKKQFSVTSKKFLREALSPLPTAALRISAKLCQALDEVSINNIGELLSVPRNALFERFGSEILLRLDQAFAAREENIPPLAYNPPLYREKTFPEPITHTESIERTTELLLDDLLAELTQREQKPAQLTLTFSSSGSYKISKNIALSVPSLNKKHLWALLRTQLEMLEVNIPIESVALSIDDSKYLRAVTEENEHLGAKVSDEKLFSKKELAELLETLAQYLGPQNIRNLECRESHLPEKSFAYCPLDYTQRNPFAGSSVKNTLVHAERPSLLFSIPRAIRAMAMLPDHPPYWLQIQGSAYKVQTGIGPERIAPPWWGENSLLSTRDYFKVQLPSGLWLWIFRDLKNSKWFLHGIWS